MVNLSKNEKEPTIYEPKVTETLSGSGQTVFPKDAINNLKASGRLERSRIYIGASICPGGHKILYFLKRSEQNPKFCQECGAAFQ